MLTSINPLGQRGRGHSWGLTVALFTLASTIGGATTGLVVGGLGSLLPVPVWVAAVACVGALLLDLTRVPSLHRQVDEDWLRRYRMWVYATGFGWQLGTGVVTIVTSAATYALLVLMLVAGLPSALLAGVTFGLVRALPLLVGRTADSPERLRDVARQLEAARPLARVITLATLGLVAVALAAS